MNIFFKSSSGYSFLKKSLTLVIIIFLCTNVTSRSNTDLHYNDVIINTYSVDKYSPDNSENQSRTTIIPDPKFEEALRDLGLDGTGNVNDGVVLTELIENRRWLFIQNKGITSLGGIQAFTALTYLYCNDNQITNLDVSNNTNLKNLYCHRNKLTSLNVSQNTLLQKLDCSFNEKLNSLDVRQNTLLKILYCVKNNLNELEVSRNVLLEKLDCQDNNLRGLYVDNNIMLKRLYCNNNDLNLLQVSGSRLLNVLFCRDNELTELDIRENTALKKLDCTLNKLRSLDVSRNVLLKELYCHRNKLESLDVSNNTVLSKFGFVRNELRSLNLKNGKNNLLSRVHGYGNPELKCVLVDNPVNFRWVNKMFDRKVRFVSDVAECEINGSKERLSNRRKGGRKRVVIKWTSPMKNVSINIEGEGHSKYSDEVIRRIDFIDNRNRLLRSFDKQEEGYNVEGLYLRSFIYVKVITDKRVLTKGVRLSGI